MSEQGMRKRIVGRTLKPLDAVSVENPAYPGTPDVNFVEGWVELKWIRRWPVRPETEVKIDHYTPQQRVWLKRRWMKGGNVWLLLQVGAEWLLFDGDTAAEVVGRATRKELQLAAHAYWPEGLRDHELRQIMERGRE